MPPLASSSLPFMPFLLAPVKLPLRYPNNSLSIRVSGIAAQFSATNGPARRLLAWWMARAKASLPVPVSPVMRIGMPLSITLRMRRTPCCSCASLPPSWLRSGWLPTERCLRLAAGGAGGRRPAGIRSPTSTSACSSSVRSSTPRAPPLVRLRSSSTPTGSRLSMRRPSRLCPV
ncbi:hypothetical protein D3C81_1342560 [compost metagenome]